MYACLYAPSFSNAVILRKVAESFSPAAEFPEPNTVVFSIDGLERLIGGPAQIASEISRQGNQHGVQANLAIASNPDAAIHAARHFAGVTLIPAGREAAMLGEISIAELAVTEEMQATLESWGIRTFAEFAALPPLGIVERFGAEGLRLQDRARGAVRRPLVLDRQPAIFERRTELEHPLDNLEPLLFLVNGALTDLCREMKMHGVAASELRLHLELDDQPNEQRTLAFATPMREPNPMLKLLHLHLDTHPPKAAITAVDVALVPVEPRVTQNGLFCPAAPEPARLQLLLARIGGLVGEENVGAAWLPDTHRPDAFVVRPFSIENTQSTAARQPERPQLILRVYRPSMEARVIVESGYPRRVAASGIIGNVTNCAGPWRGSGDWWTNAVWARDEWDVSLSDGGLYLIYRTEAKWFVAGVYD